MNVKTLLSLFCTLVLFVGCADKPRSGGTDVRVDTAPPADRKVDVDVGGGKGIDVDVDTPSGKKVDVEVGGGRGVNVDVNK